MYHIPPILTQITEILEKPCQKTRKTSTKNEDYRKQLKDTTLRKLEKQNWTIEKTWSQVHPQLREYFPKKYHCFLIHFVLSFLIIKQSYQNWSCQIWIPRSVLWQLSLSIAWNVAKNVVCPCWNLVAPSFRISDWMILKWWATVPYGYGNVACWIAISDHLALLQIIHYDQSHLIIVLLFGIVFVSLLCFLAAGFRGLNHGPQLF